MLENATFSIPYTLPFSGVTVTEIQVFADDTGQVYITGTNRTTGDNELLDFVDVWNPLDDRELCEFWKHSALPYPVKNAVEQIAYQWRRIISASPQWAKCEASAKAKHIHLSNLPLTLGEYWNKKNAVNSGFCFLRQDHLIDEN